MSMLTPPGMGGQYRIKGDRYPRMRRRSLGRRRVTLAAVAGVLALGVTGWGTLQLVDVFTGSGGETAQAASHTGTGCHSEEADATGDPKAGGRARVANTSAVPSARPSGSPSALPKPADITVNVLNATRRTNLAAHTAAELEKRGFSIGAIANAPQNLDHKVEASALLMGATGPRTAARLKVLGTQIEGAKTRYDNREGKDVDLVIGDGFTGLTPKKKATGALAALTDPSPEPSPSC